MKVGFSRMGWFAALVLAGALAVGCKPEVPTAKAEETESAAAQPKPYPLDTCIVADEKLGSMGEPYVFVHEGQELKLCCKSCLKDFHKEPATYLAKIKDAKKS